MEKNLETGIRGGSDWSACASAEVPRTTEAGFFFFLGFFFSARAGVGGLAREEDVGGGVG